MRKALFLSIGLALSLNAAADDERCVVSFAAAQQNICTDTIAHINSQIAALASTEAAKASTLRLIKFGGPIDAAQRAAVESLGAQILGYAPFHAYIVRMKPTVDVAARAIPGVVWSGAFLPAFKVDPNIAYELQHGRLADELGSNELEVSLVDPAKRPEVQNALLAIPGLALVRNIESGGESRLVVRFERAQLRTSVEQLALNDEVIAIGLRLPSYLENSQAGWLHQSNVDTPSPQRPVFDHGLFGCGQIVGALDTGLHFPHCSFNDAIQAPPVSVCTTGANCPTITAPNNAARKVIAYYKWSGLPGNQPADNHGHGTHVIGSILGQNPATAVDCTNFTTPGGNTDLDGTAPGAKLVMQEFSSNFAYLNAGGTPYHAAQTAYNNGARLHSNSWGDNCFSPLTRSCVENCSVPYNARSRDADRVMRDNADLLLLFAAGNAGATCPAGTNLTSPGNAKNVLTVGATSRGTAANAIAGFSSRGPTQDNRTKPDLVTQGEGIVSADRNACGTTIKNGTSMSAPTAAGLAALVREYLQRGFYPTGQKVAANAIPNPSGALIKAILISGAAAMNGSGTDISPGQSQGFGRILLDNSLYFDGDTSRLYIHDAAQGLATGGQDQHTLSVSQGTPFDVTLVWTDEAAAVNANPAIVNLLRLEVVAPNGEVWTQKLPPDFSATNANPFADTTTANYDSRNTVQRVRFIAPAEGSYQIRVRGISVPQGPQKYALAATGNFRSGETSADFTLLPTPESRDICAGQSTDYAIGVQSLAGFTNQVTLSVLGLPGNSSGSFSPPVVVPANPAANSTFAISNTNGVADGAYSLVVQGRTTSPALLRSTTATLNVASAAPAAAILARPADNSTGVSIVPKFIWAAVATASSYRFQLSTTPAFTNFLENQIVAATTFTPATALDSNTTYYWRVIAINGCGDAATSPTFTFTTEVAYCRSPALEIRDNSASGVSDSLSIDATGTLPRLRLWLDVTHTYVGDLTLTLNKGVTSVIVLQRPGNALDTGDTGCSGDNAKVLIDDTATKTLEANCSSDPNPAYAPGAAYKPNKQLAAFDGMERSGTWTLKAVDSAGQNVGTLNRWCVMPAAPANAADTVFKDGYE
ncbi:MAG: S8 family serine peptidase [Rhodanobacteraceae bacterium]|nr:S8 family serine peptidase [Rhodanobacteraceae bacterium]